MTLIIISERIRPSPELRTRKFRNTGNIKGTDYNIVTPNASSKVFLSIGIPSKTDRLGAALYNHLYRAPTPLFHGWDPAFAAAVVSGSFASSQNQNFLTYHQFRSLAGIRDFIYYPFSKIR
jgi:hypothetical protein